MLPRGADPGRMDRGRDSFGAPGGEVAPLVGGPGGAMSFTMPPSSIQAPSPADSLSRSLPVLDAPSRSRTPEGGLEREVTRLREENLLLRHLVAELTLDKHMLQSVLNLRPRDVHGDTVKAGAGRVSRVAGAGGG